jgi:type III secretion protein C
MSIDGTARRAMHRWLVGVAILMCAMLCASREVVAAEIAWQTDTFSYVAQNKPLKEFIREFAASQGLNVVIAPEVEGTINGRFNLTPRSMLDLLSTSFGVAWYYDGSVLYVYPAGDMTSEVIRLSAASIDELRGTLDRLGISDSRYPIAYDRRQNTARVAGPKRYVELVKQTARAIDRGGGNGSSAADIRIFPLRYAWAADFTFMQGGREYRLPGVASVLRELYAPSQRASGRAPSSSAASRESRLNRMRGLGFFRDDQLVGGTDESAPVIEEAVPSRAPLTGPELPQFQPDGRMNAVIVRDRSERMAFYEAVIRSLDVKPGLVEIEARILEVRSDAVDSLGIDWRLRSGDVDLQIGRGNLPTLDFDSALSGPSTTGGGPAVIAPPGITPPVPSADLARGGVLTTVLGDSGRFLIARINALAQEGKANVLASPRVLTLDNVEAVLENVNTFFVRVSGNLDVALFDVSSGTSLRVTPLIVTENGKRQVKLAIRIEDGSISDQAVDQIPVIQRSTIGTQAFINEGESLLIGGYENNVRRDTKVGVPGLSSIPVVGRVFTFREKQTTNVQRLFMLTPRIVEP